ncbi:M4 family metallopeptidase [Streptomyces peucetius]|uniref:Neutral metalloproteinase n=1 Tax=Streptomyces peucetius TaxID=1950 RepID=A0ABY6IEY6_STRPE|nr:M4 family metallopeptidase [Streptomyces peucetius]UYQ64462.1 M4 family metallopeptidase [Streptomyces peucetius]
MTRTTTRRTTVRAAVLTACAAMVVVGIQSGSATAGSDGTADATATAPAPSERAAALKSAQAEAGSQAKALGLDGREKLVVRDVIKDADGAVHTRYERTFDGLPVLGGDLVVHQKDNGRRSVTKATDARISVPSTSADLPASAAKKAALKVSAEHENARAAAKTARKVVWAASGKPVLAWETVVTGVQHDGTPSEMRVVTDAATGEELFSYETVHTGTGTGTGDYNGTVPLTTTANGSTFDLKDGARGGHRTFDLNQGTSGTGTLFNDADDVWGGGRQNAGVDAHYGAAVTWDYYKDVHGRNGIKNDGVAAYSRVHYGDNYVNAFWSDSCFCMTYGDGAGNSKPLTALDIAAHEMTHGVTSNTARLVYRGESGGLNEATSDIFAAAAEFHAGNSSDVADYLVGEKIDIRGNGTPLRYMDKPSKDGNSHDYWSRSLGRVDVHYSSGPANHFFYLLSEGSGAKTVNGVDYDSPTYDGKAVSGIGIAKAEQIWYKALTVYMTSTTDYQGARTATLSAAGDLYGVSSAEYQAVDAAWAAVNVNGGSTGGGKGAKTG